MTTEDQLKGFIIANYGNLKNFSEHTNVPYQTLVSILLRGIQSGKFGNIVNICHVLGISIDELSKGKIQAPPIVIDRGGRKRDLPTILRQYSFFARHEGVILLDNEPLNQEELNMVYDQVTVVMDLLRLRRKQKLMAPRKTKAELEAEKESKE